MVARPAVTPVHATGASRRLEPDAGEKSNGFREGFRFPPKKANWALGYVADWIAYLAAIIDANEEHTYQAAKTRKLIVPLWSAVTYQDSWSKASNPTGNYYWSKKDDAGTMRIVFPIGALLRDGMTITAVKMLCRPGDGRVAGNMEIALYYANPTHTGGVAVPTPTGVGTAGASAGTALQVVSATLGGAHAVVREGDSGRDYYVHITGSDATGGGASDLDFLYGVELTVTDPGPRNV